MQMSGPTVDGGFVEVAGEIEDRDAGTMLPCVSLRMPGHFAHHLSHVLADWSAIGELMESGRCADESELATLLHAAAHHSGDIMMQRGAPTMSSGVSRRGFGRRDGRRAGLWGSSRISRTQDRQTAA